MTINDRFKKTLSSVEVELACSLPICNRDYEILFFYSTQPNDEYSYKFDTLFYVYARNKDTGKITDISESVSRSDVYLKCKGAVIRPELFDDDAFDAEELYYSLYESFNESVYTNLYDDEFSITCKKLLRCFNTLVPEGPLKELYKYIGKDYFSVLTEHGKE